MLAFNDLIINNGTLSHCMLFSIDLWNRVLEVSLLNQRTNRYITLLDVAKVPFTGVGGSAFPICPVWGYRPFLQARLTRLYLAKEFCKDFGMWVTVLCLISFALLLDVCCFVVLFLQLQWWVARRSKFVWNQIATWLFMAGVPFWQHWVK